MKQSTIYILLITFLLTGCNQQEKEAQARLERARSMYQQEEYYAAKNEIDSLRSLYPKQLKVLKEGLALMREVEMKEAERNIAFCDSLLPIRMEEFDELKKAFVFEKDSLYDEVGKYIWKQQTIERNLERCYIRSGLNEKGEMHLASVFYGSKPIEHTGIKVSNPDGEFAETTSIPYDGGVNYRFANLGFTTEVVTYNGENGLEAMKFIADNIDKRIKVDYTGGKPFIIYIADGDKKAIAATYNLGIVLGDIVRMNDEKEKAEKRITYLKAKLGEE